VVAEVRATPRWRIFLSQFQDLLVWVLVAAAVVSGAVLGDAVDAAVIVAIVVLNAVIGYTQEARAEEALAALKKLAAPTAELVRSGERRQVAAEEVVPGDLLVLEAGDRVAADARVIEAFHLSVDESALTGESFPVEKGVDPVDPAAVVADRLCMVHTGTVVVAGRGRAVVTATGARTEMGRIAAMLVADEPPTPLEVQLSSVGRRIALLAGVAAVVVFAVGLAGGGNVERLFLVAVALAVAAIPEGLPAVSTITLARGVREMAERNAIVRRLPAVEALGAAQVICTDKTGTLTRNQMRVQAVAYAGEPELSPDGPVEGPLASFARVVALCSDVAPTRDGLSGDPTEVALLSSVHPGLIDAEVVRRAHPRVDEVAFDSERKRMATLHVMDGRFLLAVKGAPEVVLGRCDRMETAAGVRPFDPAARQGALRRAAEMAGRGLRTLAVAYRMLDRQPADLAAEEVGLVFVAVVGMSDDIRPEARSALESARTAGIQVVMVTGDHPVTARAVAESLGMLEGREVIEGGALEAIDAADLTGQVERIGVFARIDPAHKVKIVRAWQRRGAIVAMTGDGVNDAPALRMADIGVAMGSGTDVAKDSADVILADDHFATIVAAVQRGRAIFDNLGKVVSFLLAANVSEILVMLAGFLLFGREPLVAVQLLWVNLVTDGLPALALGVDPPAPDLMRRPPERSRSLLSLRRQGRLGVHAFLLALGPLGVLAWGSQAADLPWAETRTLAFTALVLVQLLYALAVRTSERSVWRTPLGNRSLVGAIAVSALLQLVVVVSPFGNRLFETVPLDLAGWGVVVVAGVLSLAAVDAVDRLAPKG
jgi:Ca2+-transporting ATPase